jgi:adenylate kinase
MDRGPAGQGYILDGFPRTIAQAEALDHLLKQRGETLDSVIVMEVDDDALVERIAGRFACAYCGEGYHDLYKLPKVKDVCDRCGSAGFVRRKDDNEDVVRARLKAYHAQTEPLIDYYRRQGKVSTVDGMADISAVAKEIDQALTGQGAKGVKNRAKTPG